VVGACEHNDHDHDHDHENETISRVSLTFTPTDGGAPQTFAFDDPDGDGGVSGEFERIELSAGVSYELTLSFANALVDPPEDITAEIAEEAEDHMVFILGDVVGPAAAADAPLVAHSYADLESDYGANATGEDLPVGLVNELEALAAGEGSLRVILRHLPPANDVAQKSGELPNDLAHGRELPGSADVDLTFELVVS
jgi:hypothetical protein